MHLPPRHYFHKLGTLLHSQCEPAGPDDFVDCGKCGESLPPTSMKHSSCADREMSQCTAVNLRGQTDESKENLKLDKPKDVKVVACQGITMQYRNASLFPYQFLILIKAPLFHY
jgi:hypothetical protein